MNENEKQPIDFEEKKRELSELRQAVEAHLTALRSFAGRLDMASAQLRHSDKGYDWQPGRTSFLNDLGQWINNLERICGKISGRLEEQYSERMNQLLELFRTKQGIFEQSLDKREFAEQLHTFANEVIEIGMTESNSRE